MRKLTSFELLQISGADSGDSGTTLASNAGATFGAAAGAAVGSRIGFTTSGAAIGSGLGALAGEAAYNAGKNAVNAWDPSAFQGTSFFPQTPFNVG